MVFGRRQWSRHLGGERDSEWGAARRDVMVQKRVSGERGNEEPNRAARHLQREPRSRYLSRFAWVEQVSAPW